MSSSASGIIKLKIDKALTHFNINSLILEHIFYLIRGQFYIVK